MFEAGAIDPEDLQLVFGSSAALATGASVTAQASTWIAGNSGPVTLGFADLFGGVGVYQEARAAFTGKCTP
jgi:hypothetical protein